MQTAVTMSSKNQIVVPREAREKLKLHPGSRFLVLCKEDRIVLIPRPDDFVKQMAGLHKDSWVSADDYLEGERENWEP
jgi:AbrB family looped-hinge helix DNA binding protein